MKLEGLMRIGLLVLGGEACRELLFQAERFNENAHRQRVIKSMSVPLCSLMDQIHKLMGLLNNERSVQIRNSWPLHDQENYKNIARQFRKKRFNGPVRQVRNKLAAHLDQEVIGNSQYRLRIEDFLLALGDSLILFMLIINHHYIFAWIRWIGSSESEGLHIVETLFEYPVCIRWTTDNEGRVTDTGLFQLAEDPRWEIRSYAIKAIEKFNEMVDESRVKVPKIWVNPSADLRTAEKQDTATT